MAKRHPALQVALRRLSADELLENEGEIREGLLTELFGKNKRGSSGGGKSSFIYTAAGAIGDTLQRVSRRVSGGASRMSGLVRGRASALACSRRAASCLAAAPAS